MTAYVISEVEILDEHAADHYKKFAAASIEDYDSRYLARGADAQVFEGELTQRQIVIVEFPSMDRVRQWYASSAYAKALQFRDEALERRLTFVEGITSASW